MSEETHPALQDAQRGRDNLGSLGQVPGGAVPEASGAAGAGLGCSGAGRWGPSAVPPPVLFQLAGADSVSGIYKTPD